MRNGKGVRRERDRGEIEREGEGRQRVTEEKERKRERYMVKTKELSNQSLVRLIIDKIIKSKLNGEIISSIFNGWMENVIQKVK